MQGEAEPQFMPNKKSRRFFYQYLYFHYLEHFWFELFVQIPFDRTTAAPFEHLLFEQKATPVTANRNHFRYLSRRNEVDEWAEEEEEELDKINLIGQLARVGMRKTIEKGRGLVVSVLAVYSDDPSSNHAKFFWYFLSRKMSLCVGRTKTTVDFLALE